MADETCKCGELALGRHYVRYTHARYHTRGACASTTEPSEPAEARWEQQATLIRITREERDAECRARLASEAEIGRLRRAVALWFKGHDHDCPKCRAIRAALEEPR